MTNKSYSRTTSLWHLTNFMAQKVLKIFPIQFLKFSFFRIF